MGGDGGTTASRRIAPSSLETPDSGFSSESLLGPGAFPASDFMPGEQPFSPEVSMYATFGRWGRIGGGFYMSGTQDTVGTIHSSLLLDIGMRRGPFSLSLSGGTGLFGIIPGNSVADRLILGVDPGAALFTGLDLDLPSSSRFRIGAQLKGNIFIGKSLPFFPHVPLEAGASIGKKLGENVSLAVGFSTLANIESSDVQDPWEIGFNYNSTRAFANLSAPHVQAEFAYERWGEENRFSIGAKQFINFSDFTAALGVAAFIPYSEEGGNSYPPFFRISLSFDYAGRHVRGRARVSGDVLYSEHRGNSAVQYGDARTSREAVAADPIFAEFVRQPDLESFASATNGISEDEKLRALNTYAALLYVTFNYSGSSAIENITHNEIYASITNYILAGGIQQTSDCGGISKEVARLASLWGFEAHPVGHLLNYGKHAAALVRRGNGAYVVINYGRGIISTDRTSVSEALELYAKAMGLPPSLEFVVYDENGENPRSLKTREGQMLMEATTPSRINRFLGSGR